MLVDFPKNPNPLLLSNVERVCLEPLPYAYHEESDTVFLSAMREIISWHKEYSPFYRSLLEENNFNEGSLKNTRDLDKIPAIPAEFFKRHEIISRSQKEIALTLTSSGTSGQKSKISFDEWSIRAPQSMLERQFELNGWVTADTKTNYLLYTYESEPTTSLGTSYTDLFLCRFAPVKNVEFALKRTGKGGHEFDCYGSIRALQEFSTEESPTRIFGFPSFLFFTLERMKDLNIKLTLPKGSFVFLGGGWKGFQGKSISNEALTALVTDRLGIPFENVRDGYGAVEHCIPYVDCPKHHFHVPLWSRVLIREVKTLRPLPFGEAGFLHFLSPYITSVPAHSVMMGDLASLHPADECGCGITSPFFKVLGRAGTTQNRSCAIAAAELLKEAR